MVCQEEIAPGNLRVFYLFISNYTTFNDSSGIAWISGGLLNLGGKFNVGPSFNDLEEAIKIVKEPCRCANSKKLALLALVFLRGGHVMSYLII